METLAPTGKIVWPITAPSPYVSVDDFGGGEKVVNPFHVKSKNFRRHGALARYGERVGKKKTLNWPDLSLDGCRIDVCILGRAYKTPRAGCVRYKYCSSRGLCRGYRAASFHPRRPCGCFSVSRVNTNYRFRITPTQHCVCRTRLFTLFGINASPPHTRTVNTSNQKSVYTPHGSSPPATVSTLCLAYF